MHRGTSLVGDVELTFDAIVRPPAACHCPQCRKSSGHVRASVPVARTGLGVDCPIAWSQSPRRGSRLPWDHEDDAHAAMATGSPDGPTGMHLRGHDFTADTGDGHDKAGGLPQS